MRVAVVGAGVGGLAAAIELARAGHAVTVFEANAAPGGKCARVTRGPYTWDAGPSLLTMPWVFAERPSLFQWKITLWARTARRLC